MSTALPILPSPHLSPVAASPRERPAPPPVPTGPMSFTTVCALATAALVAVGAVLATGDGDAAGTAAGNLSAVVFPAGAGWACLRMAGNHRGDEAAWRWIGLSCLVWAAGAAVRAWFGMAGDGRYPFPSAADAAWIAYALPATAGLLCLGARSARSWLWSLLDAATIAAAMLFVSWASVAGELYSAPVAGGLERVVGLAYPVAGVVLVSLVLSLTMRRPRGGRLPWMILGAGFAVLAVADSVYAALVLAGRYQVGHLFDLAWPAAFALVAAAASAPARPRPPGPPGPLSAAQELVPYLPVLAALVLGAYLPVSLQQRPFLLWNGIVLLGLVAARQVVVVSQKASLAAELEQRVAERTTQLYSEREFLGAVLDSMDEAVVACDTEGALTVLNDASRRLHGPAPAAPDQADPVSPEEWVARSELREADGVTPLAPEREPLARALRGEAVLHDEIVIAPTGGAPRLVRSTGRAVVGADGQRLGAVVTMCDITERRRLQHDLDHLAFHDPLTGLGNRARYNAAVTVMAAAARGDADRCYAAVLVDLDDFGRLNDCYGCDAGDRLLVEVSRRLRACVRDDDLSVHLGGDEWVFVLESATADHAVAVAGRMLETLATPLLLDGAEVCVAASVGVAVESDGRDADTLLGSATLALALAKNSARGSYVVFDPTMRTLSDDRLRLEAELRSALRDRDFRLAYQPVVNLATGAMTGVEALLRWEPPTGEPLGPAQFVPVAEQTGLIVALGEWALVEACHQLARWDEAGCARLTMAVNVSLTQLDRAGFAAVVAATLAATGIAPGRLVLEITESALRDDDATTAALGELRRLGVKLSIDDFGTGYSTLSRLRSCSVDYLKLDRSFVAEIGASETQDPSRKPIVRAMVAMAAGLGLGTVAEGIETPAQLEYLAGLGCEEGQGYLMSRPVGPEAIAEMAATGAPGPLMAAGRR